MWTGPLGHLCQSKPGACCRWPDEKINLVQSGSLGHKKEKKNYADSKTLPASIKDQLRNAISWCNKLKCQPGKGRSLGTWALIRYKHNLFIQEPGRSFGNRHQAIVHSTRWQCTTAHCALYVVRVGQNHTFIGIYGVHTVFLAGKSPNSRSYMVQIYGSGQPCA
jgi:hypothetical protein